MNAATATLLPLPLFGNTAFLSLKPTSAPQWLPQRLVATLLSLFLLLGSAAGQDFQRTISVTGQGTASAPPDIATIDTGVVTTAKTAKEALAENSDRLEQVLQVLGNKGIDPKDIQTSFFDVSPQFERREGGQRGDIIGYKVSNEVRVKVRDLDILGEILDALVSAGSNQISGITFGIDDNKAITDQARRFAIDDARSRAEWYAKATGVKLGKVLSISESTIAQPRPGRKIAAADFSAGAVPIATGELQVRATVFMLFELLDA